MTQWASPARVSIESLAAACALVFFRLFEPAGQSYCPLLNLTGIPCPLCGMTRALSAVMKFDVGRAIELNVLSPAILAILAAIVAGIRLPVRVWQGLGIGFVLLGIVRIAGHTL